MSLMYVLLGFWGIIEINKNKRFLFKSQANLEFHKKYSNQMHHLRDTNRWGDKKNGYLFSTIKEGFNKDNTILLQGDSWIESISEINSSTKILEDFSILSKFNIYNAGITSFAPSLMQIQYKILRKDFDINPKILIIYIDQTDIGDEFCRYRNNKIYSNSNELIRVKREKYSRATYDYSKLYFYSELNFASDLHKILKFPYKKFNYFIKRNFFQISQIKKHGYKNRNIGKCSFREIRKELLSQNLKSKEHFIETLNRYVNLLNNDDKLEKVIFVSFPHRGHLNSKYKTNVSSYIDEVLNLYDKRKIKHLNMSKLDFQEYKNKEIYKKNDIASHLKDNYHTSIFLKNILEEIKKDI